MTDTVLLNNVDHHDLKVRLGHGTEFGDAVNQTVIFPTEFEEIQRDYPILFRQGEDGRFQAVALLGLDRDENLFLDDEWQGRYVPALRQRGPFLIGFADRAVDGEPQPEPMIHVDLDHPRISRSDGAPLFRAHGGNAPYLDHVVRVLQMIHHGTQANDPMFAAFAEAGLIEPIQLQIALDEEVRYDLPGFHTIGPERLARLDGASLDRLHRAGFLRLAFMVTSSLGNVPALIERKNKKRRAGASPEAG